MRPARRTISLALTWLMLLTVAMLVLAPLAAAQDRAKYAEREDGTHIFDDRRVFNEVDEASMDDDLEAFFEETGIDVVVYTQEKAKVGARKGAREEAAVLYEEWDVGGDSGRGAVMFWNINSDGSITRNGVALGDAFSAADAKAVDEAVNSAIRTAVDAQDWVGALNIGVIELQNQLISQATLTPTPAPTPRSGSGSLRPTTSSGARPTDGIDPDAGPPFPDPFDGLSVYDYAEVISPDVITGQLQPTIDGIEERTGAEVVIYTQVKPEADSAGATEADAIALIDQWGVGREGFDDGLAIFFNLDEDDRCHGQVQLYAGPGYRAAYLSNAERQAIYENEMLPELRQCKFDAALVSAMREIDAAATADHANNLQLARQVDAVAGLIVAPLLLVGLVAWAGWSWLRYGRDPIYLDDDSILMPAPPSGMSPAAAAVVMDGRGKRRALTTAMVDLAGRGEINFRAAEGDPSRIDIDITVPDQRDARLARNRRQPLGDAEKYALSELKELGGAIRTIDSDEVPEFAKAVDGFDERLEQTVALNGWFREAPGDSIERWTRRAAVVLIAGFVGIFLGLNLPSSGLVLVAVAAIAGAIAMFVIARTMPQRTMEGARMFAQLAAYRRTLQKTLEQSRTMDQVVSSKVLPWVETPDQVMVWAYALGLHEEAEEVLARSMEDVRTGGASPTRTYFPLWYGVGARSGARISGGARAPTAGLFSSGVVPDFTAMTAAISTIGNAPSSSGGGGGGFSGGGSGGGGGGAGGGF